MCQNERRSKAEDFDTYKAFWHRTHMSTWSVYIVRCADGSLYTGISTDVPRRIQLHNEGKGAAYTRSHRPVRLVWCQRADSESNARQQEAKIKHLSKLEKERFIAL